MEQTLMLQGFGRIMVLLNEALNESTARGEISIIAACSEIGVLVAQLLLREEDPLASLVGMDLRD